MAKTKHMEIGVDGDFYKIEYITDGENIGGYLIPEFVYNEKPGLWAMILRTFKHDAGWEKVNLREQFQTLIKFLQDKGKYP